MKKEILSSIENIEIYPLISLIIFFLFFVGMFWWVVRVDKSYVNYMKEMPLVDDLQKVIHNEKN
jgi:cytochrome c oxidase cbb3-type subunit IV